MIAATEAISELPLVDMSPAKESIVDFCGDPILTATRNDKVWVSIRRVCEGLDVDFSSQLAKLKSKPWATVANFATVASDNVVRTQSMISLEAFAMWLATIDAGRVDASLRDKLNDYQCNCARVLHEYHFSPKAEMPTHAGRNIRVDHTGKVFGNWTVVRPNPENYHWIARCECGHERVVQITQLKLLRCRCKSCGKRGRHIQASPKPATVSSNSYVQVIRDYADSIDAMLVKRIAFLALPDPQTLLTHGAPQT